MKLLPPDHPGFAHLTEATTTEFGQLMELVRQAVRDKVRGLDPRMSDCYVSLSAIYADRAVYALQGRMYSVAYTVAADNSVQLAEPQEVVQTFAAVREAAGDASMREAADGAIECTLIRAGLSANGNLYTDRLLRDSVALFEGVRVFTKADAVHSAGGGKDVAGLLGGIYGIRFEAGTAPDTGRLVGTFRAINPADATVVKMVEAVRRGLSSLMGLSIDAEARTRKTKHNGATVREALAFTRVHSVDLIVEPGAGGGLDRLTEATATTPTPHGETVKIKANLYAALTLIGGAAAASVAAPAGADAPFADLTEALRESCVRQGIDPKAATAAAEAAGDEAALREALQPLIDSATRLREARGQGTRDDGSQPVTMAMLTLTNARGYARAQVAGSTLPPPAKDKVLRALLADERLTEAAVDAAIGEERDYLAKFTGGGRPTGGMARIEVGDRRAVITDMLDAFFNPKHKDHGSVMSFREAYVEITGDRYVRGIPDRARLTESIGTDTFADALGNSITRQMQREYNDAVAYDAWRAVVQRAPVNDFRVQERTQIGGYGDMPTVAERGAFNALTDPTDDKATYSVVKRGGLAQLTMEAIKNDDVGAIRRIPLELGRAAKRTLYKFVFNFFAANGTTWDGLALYHATHANLFTAALSATEWATHRLAMKKQQGRDTATRMEIGPRFLLVPDDLQEAAVNLFNRNTNLDPTFIQANAPTIIAVSTWTDVTDWVTLADPADLPVLEIGFLDGQEEPTLLVQDNPTQGSVFTNDVISYKLRHTYGGTVLVDGHKGTTKAVVAG